MRVTALRQFVRNRIQIRDAADGRRLAQPQSKRSNLIILTERTKGRRGRIARPPPE